MVAKTSGAGAEKNYTGNPRTKGEGMPMGSYKAAGANIVESRCNDGDDTSFRPKRSKGGKSMKY